MNNIKSVAGDVVHGLSGSPVILGMMVLNLLLVGGMGYLVVKVGAHNAARFDMILKSCLPPQPRDN